MNLLQFSQQQPTTITYPLTILWPARLPLAVIGEQWTRLPDERIAAVYHNSDELRLALTITQWIREPSPPLEQATLLDMSISNYAD